MSQTTYCPSCGSPNLYIGIKPKFCNSCAKPLAVGYIPPKSPPARITPVITKTKAGRNNRDDDYIDDEEDGDFQEETLNIDLGNWQIKASVTPSDGSSGMKFGELIQSKKDTEFGPARFHRKAAKLDELKQELFTGRRSGKDFQDS